MPNLSHTELLTLAALARLGDEAYGVTIREYLRSAAGRDVSLAAVYAAVDRLHQLGLVRPWMSEPRPERGGRARRQYALTPAGRARVRDERALALRLWRDVPRRRRTVAPMT